MPTLTLDDIRLRSAVQQEVMHATNEASALAIQREGFRPGEYGAWGPGIYFAFDRTETLTMYHRSQFGPVYTVYAHLLIERPYFVFDPRENGRRYNYLNEFTEFHHGDIQTRAALEAAGYDAVIYCARTFDCTPGGNQINVFNPDAILITHIEKESIE